MIIVLVVLMQVGADSVITDSTLNNKSTNVSPTPETAIPIVLSPTFASLDVDSDGFLSVQELPPRYRSRVHRLDLNGDGRVEAQELLLSNTLLGRRARRELETTARTNESRPERDPDNLIEPNSTTRAQPGINVEIDLRSLLFRPTTVEQIPANSGSNFVSLGIQLLRGIDRNADGIIETAEIDQVKDSPKSFILGQIVSSMLTQKSPRTSPLKTDPTSPEGVPPPKERAGPKPDPTPSSAATKKPPETSAPAEFPPAADIVRELDKNQNGFVERDEAVDQLAENFTRIDRDKSGHLSVDEIDRGLKLARLFGIKPKPSSAYQQHKSSNKRGK